jgi:hypothetical protein
LNSTHRHIAQKISQAAGGSILFPTDFRGLGSEDAIKMSLSRLVKEGQVERLAQGVYVKPKRKGKPANHNLDEIAQAIAKKEKVRIRRSAEFALFKLGLSSVAPEHLIYITDGEPRNIRIGDKRLVFKATTPKKLSLSQDTSGLLIQAMEELGKDKITSEVTQQIIQHLNTISNEALMADLRLAPAWIYDLFRQLIINTKNK